MLTTSRDLLLIVIAFCILWLTIFLSIFLYHLIIIVKRGREAVDLLKKKIEDVAKTIDFFKRKIDPSTTVYFATVIKGIKQLVEYIQKKKRKKKEGKEEKEEEKKEERKGRKK